jgi:hypothetical protein
MSENIKFRLKISSKEVILTSVVATGLLAMSVWSLGGGKEVAVAIEFLTHQTQVLLGQAATEVMPLEVTPLQQKTIERTKESLANLSLTENCNQENLKKFAKNELENRAFGRRFIQFNLLDAVGCFTTPTDFFEFQNILQVLYKDLRRLGLSFNDKVIDALLIQIFD